jgi:hypothetical protein
MPDAAPASSFWQRLLLQVLRAPALFGVALLMLGALLLGLLLAVGLLLWALLRGRRPGSVNLRWGAMPGRRGFGRPVDAASTAEVVDVQVREVQELRDARDLQDPRDRRLP